MDDLPQSDKDGDGDHFEVEALSEPECPPEGNGEDERVLCIDLRRKRDQRSELNPESNSELLPNLPLESTCT